MVLEAIKSEIERVRRATEALKDESDPKQKEDREKRDLVAQEQMALWAMGVFWAACASILLTLVGLGMLLGTLIYTKSAAVSAAKMVTEAEKTTAAAVGTTSEAKRHADLTEQSFVRLERPYLYVFGVHQIESDGGGVCVKYTVANYGRTPARIILHAAGMGTHPEEPIDPLVTDYRDDPEHDLLVRPVLPPGDIRADLRISPPAGIEFSIPQMPPGVFQIGMTDVTPVLEGRDKFFVWIRINYRGPTGAYMTNACWRYDNLTKRLVPWGEKKPQYNGMM